MKILNLLVAFLLCTQFLFAQKSYAVFQQGFYANENENWIEKSTVPTNNLFISVEKEKISISGNESKNYHIEGDIKKTNVGDVVVGCFSAHDDNDKKLLVFLTTQPGSNYYIFSVIDDDRRTDYHFDDK